MDRIGADGVLAAVVAPVALGGTEVRDYRFNAILCEELARVGLGLASSIGIHTDGNSAHWRSGYAGSERPCARSFR